ncbi:MAG TPA: UdgX family uracil-DNA binding protein [Myxococcales bacterium]|jgi:uracil-DNA glycosylase|nr:UdgX family uracil-DNA binding protein [Myxococcales bacterium]
MATHFPTRGDGREGGRPIAGQGSWRPSDGQGSVAEEAGGASFGDAAALIPDRASLQALRDSAAGCRACPLWRLGTQTVFGEGPRRADLLFIGEQPGDVEDRQGLPFVGPAGRLLNRALEEAGLDRSSIYLTNAVKHFKWKPRGKRRLHETPNAREVAACRPWLEAEIAAVKPRALVCLGATAAQALFGSSFRVTRQRGLLLDSPLGLPAMATVHPSAVLRAPDDQARARERAAFTADLRRLAGLLGPR